MSMFSEVSFFLNLLFFRAGRPLSPWGLCGRGSAVHGASLTDQNRPLITRLVNRSMTCHLDSLRSSAGSESPHDYVDALRLVDEWAGGEIGLAAVLIS